MSEFFKNIDNFFTKLLLVLVLLWIVLVQTNQALAQTALSSSELVLQKQRLEQEIDEQNNQLVSLLSVYQQHEREYRIARDQYKRLQTLSSIDEAILVTKKAMVSRNKVLDVYLNILRLKLINTEGIELQHKNKALELIEFSRNQLTDYEQKIQSASDRVEINQLGVEFVPLGAVIRENSYYCLNLITVGRLQTVYDKAFLLHQQIIENSQNDSTQLDQIQKTRAINETNKLVEQLPNMYLQVWAKLGKAQLEQRSENFYRSLIKDLSPIYSRLSQLISYFEELEGM